jgi:hypothetical protein
VAELTVPAWQTLIRASALAGMLAGCATTVTQDPRGTTIDDDDETPGRDVGTLDPGGDTSSGNGDTGGSDPSDPDAVSDADDPDGDAFNPDDPDAVDVADAATDADSGLTPDALLDADAPLDVAPTDTTPAPDATDTSGSTDALNDTISTDPGASWCEACTVDADCAGGARCVNLGLTSRVCLTRCTADAACAPSGVCRSVTDGGSSSQVCVPSRLDACAVNTCRTGFGDCNSTGTDGCEADLFAGQRCGTCALAAPAIGSGCGTCDRGTQTCDRTVGPVCVGDPGATVRNACGGCTTLVGVPNAACGACGGGRLTCSGTDALVCTGDSCGANLIVDGTTVTLSGNITHDEIIVRNNGRILVAPFDGSAGSGTLVMTANRVVVDASSRIDGTGRGGAGAGAGQTSFGVNDSGPGGGYGGAGGRGATDTLRAGVAFGTASGADASQGSNGGSTRCRTDGCAGCAAGTTIAGGVGGALIQIDAAVVELSGQILADGAAGGAAASVLLGGGGGSGGGIIITADRATLGGTIRAAGGTGGAGASITGCNGYSGGGGGGGRIKITAETLSNSASVSAPAGAAGALSPSGQEGAAGRNGTVSVFDIP